jgi:hypothetical protein
MRMGQEMSYLEMAHLGDPLQNEWLFGEFVNLAR